MSILIGNTKYKSIVPVMTSNTTPSPYKTSHNGGTNDAYAVFDGNDSSTMRTSILIRCPYYLVVDLGEGNEQIVNAYTIANKVYPSWSMNTWTFEGSNDGSTYNVLHTVTGMTWNATEVYSYNFYNTTPYRYYRFNCSVKNGDNSICISEIQLLSQEDTYLEFSKCIESNVPDNRTDGTDSVYFTEQGNIYMTKADGSLLKMCVPDISSDINNAVELRNDGLFVHDVGKTTGINKTDKHWWIGYDTGVVGGSITPTIDSTENHWFIGTDDTGIVDDSYTYCIEKVNNHWFIGWDTGILSEGVSISAIIKDSNNNIIVTLSDGTIKNLGSLKIDISADFLTSDGFGNLRYYNGHFQYYNETSSTWIDTSATPDNIIFMNLTPNPMQNIYGKYNKETGHCEIKFTEPDDTYIDRQLLCAIEKIVLVRKKDSEPKSIDDGVKVLELKRADFGLYKIQPYIDESISPNIGEFYYYKAFPVSTAGYVNDFSENATKIEITNVTVYGFKIDQNESNPASMITYLSDCDNANFNSAYMDYTTDKFNYGDWGDAWFIKNLKPCMLKYDGTVDYELNPNDYTKKLDGTDSDIANSDYEGNAMVGIPKVYWKIVDNGDNTANVYISDAKIDDDFVCWSHVDNNGNEIDYCYIAIYLGSVINSKLRSISNVNPTYSNTTSTEVTYATANNLTSDVIWYTKLYSDTVLITLLLLLIGKSTDSQTTFGYGYVAKGATKCKNGTANAKGLFWGAKNYNTCAKIFGIEHWWGAMMTRIAGWICDYGTQKIKLTYGKHDGSTVDGYNIDGTGYISLANSTPIGSDGGYISKLLFINNSFVPVKVTGSSTTYYTDSFWIRNSQKSCVIFGGNFDAVERAGMFYTNFYIAYNGNRSDVGTTLSCKPLATT